MMEDTRLVTVELIGLPLDIQARAEEHNEELMREFTHIAHSTPDVTERIPNRLLALVARLRAEYDPVTAPARDTMEAARAQDQTSVNLTYLVPPAASRAADQLWELLDEADEFCRSGDLLTLATPSDLLRYRRWFLGEFRRQIAGELPNAWNDTEATERRNDADERMNGLIAEVREEVSDLRAHMERFEDDSTDG